MDCTPLERLQRELRYKDPRKEAIDVLYWDETIRLKRINIFADNNKLFRDACIYGHLKFARYIYKESQLKKNKNKLDIHIWNEFPFCWSCAHGFLDVAIWLHSLGNIDIHAGHDFAFVMAINMGHLDVAKWLFALCNSQHFCSYCQKKDPYLMDLERKIMLNTAFEEAVRFNRIDCLLWIYDKKPQPVDVIINLFKWCCDNPFKEEGVLGATEKTAISLLSYLKLTKQVFGSYPSELHSLFKKICRNKWFDLAMLFVHIDDRLNITIDHEGNFVWKILTLEEYIEIQKDIDEKRARRRNRSQSIL